jgi:hypothetical protein
MRHLGLILLLGLVGCLVDGDESLWKNRHDATRDRLQRDGPTADQAVADRLAGDGPAGDLLARDRPAGDLPARDGLPPAPDKLAPDTVPPCTTGQFECLAGGTARHCTTGQWKLVGSCVLGCDAPTKACRVPSNVAVDAVLKGTGHLDLTGKGATITISTDTGEISLVRGKVTGLDPVSGIYYEQVAQAGAPGLGVFAMKKLVIPDGTTVKVSGTRALVLLAGDTASVLGAIDVSAAGKTAGPGGIDGGAAGAAAAGIGGGKPGTGDNYGSYCAGGGGGGGHGGAGGAGGASTCATPHNFSGGAGGIAFGGVTLAPLVGGGGGAGGTLATGATDSYPGPGGGGGGAIQLVSTVSLSFGPKASINAGGGGGGQTVSGGGAGGGAGGGILLEAPTVTVATGAILAANGGGGGGGDCT